MPQGDFQPTSHTIEVAFAIRGERIPVDHGYALFAALSRLPVAGPWLHASDALGLHLIRGRYVGDGLLSLTEHSRLAVRLSAADLPNLLSIAGKTLDLDGHRLGIGVPQTTLLRPAAALYAHLVTTRNGQDEARFDGEIQHQLDTLGIAGKVMRGKRRVMRVKDKRVVAHSLLVSELSTEDSIRLQETGLGGRRKMGCGIFVPTEKAP